MAESRQRVDRQRTAAMMAHTANLQRDPKKRSKPYVAEDFIRVAPRPRGGGTKGVPITAANIEILKQYVK